MSIHQSLWHYFNCLSCLQQFILLSITEKADCLCPCRYHNWHSCGVIAPAFDVWVKSVFWLSHKSAGPDFPASATLSEYRCALRAMFVTGRTRGSPSGVARRWEFGGDGAIIPGNTLFNPSFEWAKLFFRSKVVNFFFSFLEVGKQQCLCWGGEGQQTQRPPMVVNAQSRRHWVNELTTARNIETEANGSLCLSYSVANNSPWMCRLFHAYVWIWYTCTFKIQHLDTH